MYSQLGETFASTTTGVGFYKIDNNTQITAMMGWNGSFDNTVASLQVWTSDETGYKKIKDVSQEGRGLVSVTLSYGGFESYVTCQVVTQ